MTVRTIKVIKPYQAERNAAVPIAETRELGETEIRAKRVLIVQNWIAERRDNDIEARSGMRREVIEWRKFDGAAPVKKIAISALTE